MSRQRQPKRRGRAAPSGSPGSRRFHVARPAIALSREWQLWAVENLLRGAKAAELCRALVSRGVPLRVAAEELAKLEDSPALHACRWLEQRRSALARRADLLNELRRNMTQVERVPMLSGEDFFARYYATNTPVVLTELSRDWPALARWTPHYLREHYGSAEVEIVEGRSGDPFSDRQYERLRRTVTMADLVTRIETSGPTNDFYAIARNRNVESPAFAELRRDVIPPTDWFEPERVQGAQSFWLGPAGTITALHHDPTNILFCQIFGRKRVHLAPPSDAALLRAASGFYSNLVYGQPEDQAELRATPLLKVDLGPGDALFIPALWWHRVEALTESISFSLLHFRRPNRFPDYHP